MIASVKLKKTFTNFLLFFMLFENVLSKCEVYLNEVDTSIVPFLNEIPQNYNLTGEFDQTFDTFLKEFKNHSNNIFKFRRYCKNLNDENAGIYGFAIIEVFDNLESKPIIHQYFKFNDSYFNNGILLVGSVNGTKYNEKIEIQKISYKTFLAKESVASSRKYVISKNYVFLIFEHSSKTAWMDVHFDYGEKYVSFQKIDTLIEASVDAFVLAENYGIEWLKELIRKLNIPTFSFQSSNNQSWSRCCNNWFLSASSIGTSENSCCSSDLQHLPFKGLPFQYKEAITCKVSGCLLDEGKRAKIKIENEETFVVTVSKLNEKNVSLKYFKNETEYDTVIEYEKIFSSNTHITILNCTFEMPEILDIDEFNGTQTFNTHITQNDIIICYFNETMNEKMCGNFWVGQNIIILDAHQSETLGIITRIFPNFNQIYAKVSDIVRTFSFNQLKQYNSQMFDRKICYDNIFTSLKQMPLKAINIETFNRSLAMSKIFQIGQKINAEPLVDDNSNIKVATIIQLSKVFVKVKDDKSGKIFRQSYKQTILKNPLIFDNLETDNAVELYRIENGKQYFSFIKLNQNISSFDFDGTVNKIFGDLGMVLLDTTEGTVSIPIEDIYHSNPEIIKEKKVAEECQKFKGKKFNRHQRKKGNDCNN